MSNLLVLDSFSPVSNKLIEKVKRITSENEFENIYFVSKSFLLAQDDIGVRISKKIYGIDILEKDDEIHKSSFFQHLKQNESFYLSDSIDHIEMIPSYFLKKENLALLCSDSGKEIREGKDFTCTNINVLLEILNHRIYFASLLSSLLTANRYEHVVSVALTCYQLALNHPQINPYLAFQAGLFHDAGKDLEVKKQREIVFSLGYDIKEDYALHQYVSKEFARNLFHIQNEDVLNAIACHCTGKKEMSLLDKILYVSDKIEPKRKFNTGDLPSICKQDIDKGFVEVLKWQIEYFKKTGEPYSTNPDTIEMYKTYLGR